MLLALSLFVHVGSDQLFAVRVQWTDLLWLLSLALLFFLLRSTLLELPGALLGAAAVFLFAATCALLANFGHGQLLKYLGYWALILTSLVCWAWARCRPQWTVRALRWLLLLLVITTFGGWLLGMLGIEGWGSRQFQGAFYMRATRAVGLTNHPDRAALVLLVVYGLFLLHWRPRAGLWTDLLAWATPWLALTTLAPFSALLFAELGCALLIRAEGRGWRVVTGAMLAAAVLVTAMLSYLVPVRDATGHWRFEPAPRAVMQAATVPVVAARPWLGHGLAFKGAPLFSTGYPPVSVAMRADPHSAYLDLAASGGVLLLAGFVVWLTVLARPVAPLWWGIVLVWLVCGLFHSINDERMVYFGLGIGAALAAVSGRASQAARASLL